MEKIGTWWNSNSIELVRVDGEVYALNGWNSERYLDCWKCSGNFFMDASDERYTLRPIYRFEAEGTDLPEETDETLDEWERAVEIVDFDVTKN